jgi:hypothetical protein
MRAFPLIEWIAVRAAVQRGVHAEAADKNAAVSAAAVWFAGGK